MKELDYSKESIFFKWEILLYISLSIDILGFLASCVTFVYSCVDYGTASKRSGCVVPWVIWCFVVVVFNIGCAIYSLQVSHQVFSESLGSFRYKIYLNSVWFTFCGIVGISYMQNMKEGYQPRYHAQVMMTDVPQIHGNPPPYVKLEA